MPIYEYYCKNCDQEHEIIAKINDPDLTQCPKCKSKSFNKQISATNFKLKGKGWYATDFKNQSKEPSSSDKCQDCPKNVSDAGKSSTNTASSCSSEKNQNTTK